MEPSELPVFGLRLREVGVSQKYKTPPSVEPLARLFVSAVPTGTRWGEGTGSAFRVAIRRGGLGRLYVAVLIKSAYCEHLRDLALIAHRPRRQNMGLFECLTTYSLSCYYIVRNKRGSVEPAGDPVGIVRVGDYLLAGSLWQLLQYSGVVEGKSCWHSWGMGKP